MDLSSHTIYRDLSMRLEEYQEQEKPHKKKKLLFARLKALLGQIEITECAEQQERLILKTAHWFYNANSSFDVCLQPIRQVESLPPIENTVRVSLRFDTKSPIALSKKISIVNNTRKSPLSKNNLKKLLFNKWNTSYEKEKEKGLRKNETKIVYGKRENISSLSTPIVVNVADRSFSKQSEYLEDAHLIKQRLSRVSVKLGLKEIGYAVGLNSERTGGLLPVGGEKLDSKNPPEKFDLHNIAD